MPAFQIKDFVSITASMVNYARRATTLFSDFNVGSKVRTILESAAAEIEQLYQNMVRGLTQAIPVAVYNSFNFPALAATAASQPVLITITAQTTPVIVSAGTVGTRADQAQTYTVQGDVTIPAGTTTATVLLVCTAAGTAGNTPPTTFTFSPSPPGFVSAANSIAFSNGTDPETAAARLARFQEYISTLARGTLAAIDYGLKSATLTDASGNVTERVKLAVEIEPWVADNTQPVGLVNCWVHNGVGNTSTQLVSLALKIVQGYQNTDGSLVDGWKAAGVQVTVSAAPEAAQVVTGTMTFSDAVSAATGPATAQALQGAYIQALPLGATIEVAKLIALAMGVPGCTNFVPSAPAADVPAATAFTKPMPGAITITPAIA